MKSEAMKVDAIRVDETEDKERSFETLLEWLKKLPDISKIAEESQEGDIAAKVESLKKEYMAKYIPFILSFPLRHRVLCSTGEHDFGEKKYEVYLPLKPPPHKPPPLALQGTGREKKEVKAKDGTVSAPSEINYEDTYERVVIRESEIHEIRYHNGRITENVGRLFGFLEGRKEENHAASKKEKPKREMKKEGGKKKR